MTKEQRKTVDKLIEGAFGLYTPEEMAELFKGREYPPQKKTA